MVTTNQKSPIDSQKPKKKELKHTTKENHQTTIGKTKRRRNKQRKIIESSKGKMTNNIQGNSHKVNS